MKELIFIKSNPKNKLRKGCFKIDFVFFTSIRDVGSLIEQVSLCLIYQFPAKQQVGKSYIIGNKPAVYLMSWIELMVQIHIFL